MNRARRPTPTWHRGASSARQAASLGDQLQGVTPLALDSASGSGSSPVAGRASAPAGFVHSVAATNRPAH